MKRGSVYVSDSESDTGEDDASPSGRVHELPNTACAKLRLSKIFPRVLCTIILLLAANGPLTSVTSVELFAGCHSVTNGMKALGHSAVSLDFSTVSLWDDINTTPGFLRALTYVTALEPQGLLWAAPPCSSWVWVGRSQTGRSKDHPLGDDTKPFVERANTQVARVVLLVLTALLMHNAMFIAEQPSSSIFEEHPRWKQLQSILGEDLHRVHMWMQPYGGSSPKATLLYSNDAGLGDLWIPLDTSKEKEIETVTRTMNSAGKECVTGTKALKGTQAYPFKFGKRVAEVFTNSRAVHVLPDGIPLHALASVSGDGDDWLDAGLPQVLAELRASLA